MEQEIEDELNLRYQRLILRVEFFDIRKYLINIQIEHLGEYKKLSLVYTYNVKLTFMQNISIIESYIDKQLIIPFYKREE